MGRRYETVREPWKSERVVREVKSKTTYNLRKKTKKSLKKTTQTSSVLTVSYEKNFETRQRSSSQPVIMGKKIKILTETDDGPPDHFHHYFIFFSITSLGTRASGRVAYARRDEKNKQRPTGRMAEMCAENDDRGVTLPNPLVGCDRKRIRTTTERDTMCARATHTRRIPSETARCSSRLIIY